MFNFNKGATCKLTNKQIFDQNNNAVWGTVVMPLLITSWGPPFPPPSAPMRWDVALQREPQQPAAAVKTDWEETKPNLRPPRRTAPAESSLKWKKRFGARGWKSWSSKDIYPFLSFFSLEDVLCTLANHIERQRRGSGLHWIFFVPLPFRVRVGRERRYGGHHSRCHLGEKRKSETRDEFFVFPWVSRFILVFPFVFVRLVM